MKTLDYLLNREWSMGNGQCPECCGCPPDWFGHPLHMTPETIGHEKDCPLAAAIKALGCEPTMLGEFKSDIEWETCGLPIGNGMHALSTQVKGSNPEARQVAEEWERGLQERFNKDLFDRLMAHPE